MAKEFEIRREVELPATPEDVWDAVATGPGTASWLFPSEPGPNDAVEADRPHRFAVRTEGEGGFFNALEFVIEARGGDTAVLRYVHSGIFMDDWDTMYDAASTHTDFYLHTLGQYLEHFAPKTATYVGGGPDGINGPEASIAPDAFETLKRTLGASGEGDRVSLPDGGGGEGVVDYVNDKFLGVRTDDALYCFFGRYRYGGPVAVSVHHFGNGVDPDTAGDAWRDWLAGVYR